MSKIRRIKLVCEECGKEFESTHFDSVNVTLDPNLREQALSGEVFTKKCPHCGHEHFHFGDLLYHDMEHGFMIQCGSGPELFLSSIDQEHGLAAVQNQFGIKLNIKMLGATSLHDLRTKVAALENRLDFRAASIVCYQVAEAQREQGQKALPKEDGLLGGMCFFFCFWLEKTPDGFVIQARLESWVKDTTEEEQLALPFPMKQYERIMKDDIGLIDAMAPFYFDESVVKRFLNFDRDTLDWYKNTKSKIAIGRDLQGKRHFLEILPFKSSDFKEGDIVIARKGHQNSGKLNGYLLEKIVDVPEIQIPIVYKDRGIVLWKHEPTPMVTSEDSDAEIDNEELIEAMEKANGKGGKNFDVLLSQADGIVCTVAQLKDGISEEDFQRAMEAGQIPPEWVDLDLLTVTSKKDKKEALCVFLSQEAAKHAEKSSNGKQIYPMDQIINFVLRNPDRFGGIVFDMSNNGPRHFMNISELLYYKHGRIMLDPKRMVNLLEKLTPPEKEYITDEYLQVIQMVYYEEKKPEEIAKEIGITSDEVGNRLSWGYTMLVDVVQANY